MESHVDIVPWRMTNLPMFADKLSAMFSGFLLFVFNIFKLDDFQSPSDRYRFIFRRSWLQASTWTPLHLTHVCGGFTVAFQKKSWSITVNYATKALSHIIFSSLSIRYSTIRRHFQGVVTENVVEQKKKQDVERQWKVLSISHFLRQQRSLRVIIVSS